MELELGEVGGGDAVRLIGEQVGGEFGWKLISGEKDGGDGIGTLAEGQVNSSDCTSGSVMEVTVVELVDDG